MQSPKRHISIALVGNPNSGKTSLFNELTGLRQQVGNFPGVTVDKKTGASRINTNLDATIIDLPGTYSLYPRRADEWVSYRVMLGEDNDVKPEMAVIVVDACNLRRSLLFCTQVLDLGIPSIIALTMQDLAQKQGIKIDVAALQTELGVPIVEINPRKGKGLEDLRRLIAQATSLSKAPPEFLYSSMLAPAAVLEMQHLNSRLNNYQSIHHLIHFDSLLYTNDQKNAIRDIIARHGFRSTKTQAEEIFQRYERIRFILQSCVNETSPEQRSRLTEKIDAVLLHPIGGYVILLTVLFVLFQSVFWLAQYPMDGIDWLFGKLTDWLTALLPVHMLTDLFINGILAGLGGILVFIPQIMILFSLISLLEDSGYMARISFLTDRLMRKVGLNGKSVMPMISGYACAVPAIMSARNIENRKERLLTILITPFMSCSARLPVYFMLTALVVPDETIAGFIGLRGLVIMGLYLFGTIVAIGVAWILKFFIRSAEKSYFILELPMYRSPRWKNAWITMVEKAKIFVLDAGKIILLISIVLWTLSNFGPYDKREQIEIKYTSALQNNPALAVQLEQEKNTELLQFSYAGMIGRTIEPVIKPLGYDWKIGIALVTSFAAREVFVGTMATLYSVDADEEKEGQTLRDKMAVATNEKGEKIYTAATGFSLLIFYALAMQCMSTLAVVRRETRSWKWPAVQLILMTGLAYLLSWAAYVFLR
jgi:ferrous iron transport protein B